MHTPLAGIGATSLKGIITVYFPGIICPCQSINGLRDSNALLPIYPVVSTVATAYKVGVPNATSAYPTTATRPLAIGTVDGISQ